MRDNETNDEVRRHIIISNSDVLIMPIPHIEWWSTFKSAVYDSCSSLPPLVGWVGEQWR